MTKLSTSRSLNKPHLFLGIPQKMAGFCLLIAALAAQIASTFIGTLIASLLILSLWWTVRKIIQREPSPVEVFSRFWRQKRIYDPLKRAYFGYQQERVEEEQDW